MTKLVEWPVVDKVPLRVDVLYRGHLYPIYLYSSFVTGSSHMTGISSNNTFGYDSVRHIFSLSHLHPSTNNPWIFTPLSAASVQFSISNGLNSVLNINVSIAIWFFLEYTYKAAVMKPWGKNMALAQYDFNSSFSTHSLKNSTLAMKSVYQEPNGFKEG